MARSIDEIIEELREVLKEQGSSLANFPNYGNLYSIFRSIASVVSSQNTEIDLLQQSLFLTTSTSVNLDKKALEYGLTRNQGQKATGTIIVEASLEDRRTRNIIIPRNTILLNPSTNKQYQTLERVLIEKERTNILVESIEANISSNVEGGTKLISNFYKNLDFTVGESYNFITNEYEGDITGGTDKETDSELRTRILNVSKLKQPSSTAALEAITNQEPGINKVLIEENVPALGYINVYVDNSNFTKISNLREKLQVLKPPGTILQVYSFTKRSINITVNVKFRSNDNITNKINSLKSALTSFVAESDNIISREAIAATILNNSSVTNVEVLSPVANTSISKKEQFVIGVINIQPI